MRFTNTLRLLMENFKQVLRLFLSKVITMVVVIALCAVFVVPELMEIIKNPVTQELVEDFKNIFLSLIDHELGQNPSHFIDKIFEPGGTLSQFAKLLLSMSLELTLVSIGCVLVYLIKCFVDEVIHFTVGSMVNDKMATYAETPFSTAFVANLGKASNYAWLYTIVTFVTDMITLLIIFVFLRFMPILLALFLGMTLIVGVQALKMTLTSAWMPAMTTDGEKLKEALRYKDSHEKKYFTRAFILYTILLYVVIIVNVVAALCTFGSALLITIPTSYLLFICAQYVNYYTMKGKKYFITYENIATNPDRGDHAHFFNYIEEAEKNVDEKTEITQEEK